MTTITEADVESAALDWRVNSWEGNEHVANAMPPWQVPSHEFGLGSACACYRTCALRGGCIWLDA